MIVHAKLTTLQPRTNAILLATRAADRAQARKREAPASKVVVALADDVIALAEMVEILCGALAESEFGRR